MTTLLEDALVVQSQRYLDAVAESHAQGDARRKAMLVVNAALECVDWPSLLMGYDEPSGPLNTIMHALIAGGFMTKDGVRLP